VSDGAGLLAVPLDLPRFITNNQPLLLHPRIGYALRRNSAEMPRNR
jgi:hypothetical protein